MNTPDTFWNRVLMDSDGCWEYQMPRKRRCGDYPSVRYSGKYWRSNRLAWFLTHGTIPDDMYVCHHCDNPRCVRPDHLFLGTADDNNKDKAAKGRARSGAHKLRKLSDEQVIEALRRHNDGETIVSVAAHYGISERKLRKRFEQVKKKYGVSKRPRRPVVDVYLIKRMQASGMSRKGIATELGITVWNVDRTLDEYKQTGPEAHRV